MQNNVEIKVFTTDKSDYDKVISLFQNMARKVDTKALLVLAEKVEKEPDFLSTKLRNPFVKKALGL